MKLNPPDKGSTITRLFGGADISDSRVHSGWLAGSLLAFSPVAAALRFGGYPVGSVGAWLVNAIPWLAAFLVIFQWIYSIRTATNPAAFMSRRRGWSASCIAGPVLVAAAAIQGGEINAWGFLVTWLTLTGVHRAFEAVMASTFFGRRPALTLALTFVLLALTGAVLLDTAPRALAPGQEITFIDALFTATSATCVTGLEVVPTGTTFTVFGQAVVLAMIQLGGLGLMTLGTFLLLTSGRRLGVSDRALVRDVLNVEGAGGVVRLVVAIFVVTLGCELVGALALRGAFSDHPSPEFAAFFHAVSAFCNAGFALEPDSFARFARSPGVNAVVITLVIVGGLGFTVFRELAERLVARLRRQVPRRLSIHTRFVVASSAVLIGVGTVGFWLLERDGVLAGESPGSQALMSVFQSVSSRTAGFATVDFGREGLSDASRFFLLPLMMVGASPGSTGGGIKTTTLVVLFLAVGALFRNRTHVVSMGRTIPDDIVKRAGAIVTLYLFLVFVAVLALLASEHDRFAMADLLFEAVSAVATVGFSVGVSSAEGFSDFGKLVLTVLMFCGRLGPLTLVLVTASKGRGPSSLSYPDERVMIG